MLWSKCYQLIQYTESKLYFNVSTLIVQGLGNAGSKTQINREKNIYSHRPSNAPKDISKSIPIYR